MPVDIHINHNNFTTTNIPINQKNFYSYINAFRVEEFKERVVSQKYTHLTILAIALDCGFNSKSTFNRIFKQATGITPNEFVKSHTH